MKSNKKSKRKFKGVYECFTYRKQWKMGYLQWQVGWLVFEVLLLNKQRRTAFPTKTWKHSTRNKLPSDKFWMTTAITRHKTFKQYIIIAGRLLLWGDKTKSSCSLARRSLGCARFNPLVLEPESKFLSTLPCVGFVGAG